LSTIKPIKQLNIIIEFKLLFASNIHCEYNNQSAAIWLR